MDYIAVKTIDGRDVLINRTAIVTIGGARDSTHSQLLTDKAVCTVTLIDGKFITVVETCEVLRERLGLERQPAAPGPQQQQPRPKARP